MTMNPLPCLPPLQRLIREEWEALQQKERAESQQKEKEKLEKEVMLRLLIRVVLSMDILRYNVVMGIVLGCR